MKRFDKKYKEEALEDLKLKERNRAKEVFMILDRLTSIWLRNSSTEIDIVLVT